ncbi:MAG TPA: HAMP domain-containing protein [Dyella sp.]|uniref:HAMP domain-containing protein n=1 Tax=Dyella sp. TaxID=1869338 RepID=UPI002B979771|nr:HAMP domain-containing protein [Dyella sp.]HUB90608.1 HAMP domain-containing protein [Dyella sp.]
MTTDTWETLERRQVIAALRSFRRGDFHVRLPEDLDGPDGELAQLFNEVVDLNQQMTAELERLSQVVGKEGKISQRGRVRAATGGWENAILAVNEMIEDMVQPTTEVARVIGAVAKGDLSQSMTVEIDGRPLRGEFLRIGKVVNTMVEQLASFASEVTRVAREVGTEGKLGGQATVRGVAGTWKDLTDNVNAMATNLTSQVRNIAEVTTAVASGDLSKKITVEVKGEILELKNTINTMVDQLNSFASEVTRVAREVGTEGKLGGQARVEGAAGIWKNLTDNVNLMADNLTGQVRNIAEVTTAVARGDLSKKITVDVKGEILELKNTVNTMVDQLNSFASEVTRVAREVGSEGKLGGQARVEGVGGTWKDLTDNVNLMAGNLTGQVRNIAEVTTAVAQGDLSRKITVDVKGEILALKNTTNTMVDQLNSFASEVSRVAREVGTDGKLGGQAQVPGVGGTWKDLTDNVNLMATNLTNQVRGIAEVVTAVAQGNLKRKLSVDAKGEIAALADTINGMIETLATFADQVTNMAREVGIEGKLGGQARVPGAAGLWRDLTDNVNQLAANLTNQVRSIADVATAVTKGDLSRSIAVEASGEMASLKDNINEMICNLKDQTLKNAEQDWLKTNLARFSRMLQGERDLATVSNLIMSELAPLVNAQYGVFYVTRREENETVLELVATYGATNRDALKPTFQLREGLIGQCAADKRAILLSDVPPDFIRICSGLGEAAPVNIAVLPALFENDVRAVIELGSFSRFNETHQSFLDQLMESVGIVLNTIAATMRTEGLLKQSQLLTHELQARQTELTTKQKELHTTNEELQEKAQLLENEKKQVEAKNFEIELARRAVEEKAEQLALTSKYKSEFLANMSHELRTPLNSLLILSRLLADNPQGNLNDKQTEFARTIHSAGSDLLNLINDILDLSKIESGTVSIEIGDMAMNSLKQHMERTFRQLAADKNLDFQVNFGADLPASIRTDEKRLQQIVLNLLSNAFKFTSEGGVTLSVNRATGGWSTHHPVLRDAECAIEIAVTDSGIGIPKDKQKLIFEAFQQADGTTSRKYGGTGLGLSISREIAHLLGGELQVRSTPGAGSTFTLFVPMELPSHASAAPGTHNARYDNSGTILPNALPAQLEVTDDRDALDDAPFVLIVEDDPTFASILLDIARDVGLKGVVSTAGAGTLVLARKLRPHAITLDLGLSDIDGFVLLDLLRHDPYTTNVPIHIISGAEKLLTEHSLSEYGVTEKPATLDQLTAVFAELAQRIRQAPASPPPTPADGPPITALRPVPELAGAKVLIVDDDIRNIYSLTSVLENYAVEVLHAERGRDGILILEQTPGIDLALIDIMMPEMDGYETMQQIRAQRHLAKVPLIAVTAKAMKGDRQKCLDAGASDYIAKPVDIELLLALLRVWITRSRERAATHAFGAELALENQP